MVEIEENARKKAPGAARKRSAGSSMRLSAVRLKRMIKKVLDNLENEETSSKATVGELLKLLQAYNELTAAQVKEVEVRWVDRLGTEKESGT